MFRLVQKIFCTMALLALSHALAFANGPLPKPGVLATFQTEKQTDSLVLPNFWFHHPQGEPPAAFLPDVPYTVEFMGLVSVNLRGQFSLEAELNGELAVTVNGKEVLRATEDGALTERSNPFRLNKGTNSVVARFTPPAEGSARMRLYWIPRKGFPEPIPGDTITHLPHDRLLATESLRRGRNLFAHLRCSKCHETELTGMPELSMDAPTFARIGDRLNAEWMARWILNPQAERTSARMPKMLHGPEANEDAVAIAAFLGSLRIKGKSEGLTGQGGEETASGQALYVDFRCGSCHSGQGNENTEAGLIDLEHVSHKFLPGGLAEYLLNPQANYSWNRMPDFRLTSAEAAALAEFVEGGEERPLAKPNEELIQKGKLLAQTTGCLNCHSLELENKFRAPPLAQVSAKLDHGCLAINPSGVVPVFALSEQDREDLRNFLKTGLDSLQRDTLREFTLRQTSELNCAACHGEAEGFTRFGLLGEKLDPSWTAEFLSGEFPDKPRPWLPARMPVFREHANTLASGLAVLHGFSPTAPVETPVDRELAEIGRKLISAEGGFSCTACHAVGASAPAQVFEAPGINLAMSGARLREPFFRRWMLNPLAVDPATKMPVYFDSEGRSPLTEIFGGDAHKQIEAIWEYLRSGAGGQTKP